MSAVVDTRDPSAVQKEAQSTYLSMFPDGDRFFVARAFEWAVACFQGRYRNYQAVDAHYHDLEHTMQGTLCMCHLLRGWQTAGGQPPLNSRLFELSLLAILLHDTGYLKTRDDTEGTGAKYTLIHVSRSAEFAAALLAEKAYGAPEIAAVQNMIRCTGVNIDLNAIPFHSELERLLGFALGTSDLLGQMSATDYIDKLPVLYLELEESQRFNQGRVGEVGTFPSADDLIRRTPMFWENYVVSKINKDFRGLYRYLNQPYPDGPNDYLRRIESGINGLRQRLAASST